jgi:hypothetical protein
MSQINAKAQHMKQTISDLLLRKLVSYVINFKRMKPLLFTFSFFLLISCNIFKSTPIKPTNRSLLLSNTEEIVKTLSSDKFEGREPGTLGIQQASHFVEDILIQAGVLPFWNTSFYDTLELPGSKHYNLVGLIPADSITDEYVLIGAHLDHLGKTDYPDDSVYNGANDNATGVAAVLNIARELTKQKLNKNVLIAIFTLEETGLLGSKHLAKKLKSKQVNLSYVINFEMIGVPLKDNPGKVYITGYHISDFASVANGLMEEEFIIYEEIDTQYGLFRIADNYPFYKEYSIPSHTVSTYAFNNYPFYHHVNDEYSALNIQHMEVIISKMTELILKLLSSDNEIHLTGS